MCAIFCLSPDYSLTSVSSGLRIYTRENSEKRGDYTGKTCKKSSKTLNLDAISIVICAGWSVMRVTVSYLGAKTITLVWGCQGREDLQQQTPSSSLSYPNTHSLTCMVMATKINNTSKNWRLSHELNLQINCGFTESLALSCKPANRMQLILDARLHWVVTIFSTAQKANARWYRQVLILF